MVNRGLVSDPRRDRTLATLINKGLYDRKWEEQYQNVPEERAMRYAAVCTSMLSDWVEGLKESRTSFEPRVHNLEQVTSSLMGWQDKLNDKVNILSYDWNLNLKYRAQVVDFEAKMLLFSLNELVLVHEDWSQLNSLVQEQFGLHQDQIVTVEETLRSLMSKVRVSLSKSILTFAEESLLGF